MRSLIIAIALMTVMGSLRAVHATESCDAIKNSMVRQRCPDRQATESATKRSTVATVDPIEALKEEDNRLAKKLRGICRGC